MNSSSPHLHEQLTEDEEAYLATMELVSKHALVMSVTAAIELDVFNILARAGPTTPLSAANIAAEIPHPQQPDAPDRLDRLLRFLASHAVLRCSPVVNQNGGHVERFYALEPIYRFLARNPNGVTLAPTFPFVTSKASLDKWQYLKEAVLEDIAPFEKATGMKLFEYTLKEPRFGELFNEFMASHTNLTAEKIVDTYVGFGSVTKLVDVGGGTGALLQMITSKYPHIKGINFDLPHVISTAPKMPRVDHVEGDFFVKIPKGDAIILKLILHNWNDDCCKKILRSCYEALPEGGNGKVIVVERILVEIPERSNAVRNVYFMDLSMMTSNRGARERTEIEYKALAAEVGFAQTKVACHVMNLCVMEFIK